MWWSGWLKDRPGGAPRPDSNVLRFEGGAIASIDNGHAWLCTVDDWSFACAEMQTLDVGGAKVLRRDASTLKLATDFATCVHPLTLMLSPLCDGLTTATRSHVAARDASL